MRQNAIHRKRQSSSVGESTIRIEHARRILGTNIFGLEEWGQYYPFLPFSKDEIDQSQRFPWNESQLNDWTTFNFKKDKRVSETHFAFFSPLLIGNGMQMDFDGFNYLQRKTQKKTLVFAWDNTIPKLVCKPGWHMVTIPPPTYVIPRTSNSNLFSAWKKLNEVLPAQYTFATDIEMLIALHLFHILVLKSRSWSLKCLVTSDSFDSIPILLSAGESFLLERCRNNTRAEREFDYQTTHSILDVGLSLKRFPQG